MTSSPARPSDLHQRRYAARTARASATKARVARAAHRLFTERGYLYTTMADIAAEASVAVQTLYLSFGGKAQILSAAFDLSVAGDDEPVAVLNRPWVSALRDEHDLRQALRLLVAEGTAIIARATPIYLRVQEACADAEVAEVLATQRARRYQTDRGLAALLAAKPGFAADLTVDQAGDILYAVLSEDTYRLFCMDRSWELGQWQAWCLTSLQTTLADRPGPAAGSSPDVGTKRPSHRGGDEHRPRRRS
jgi:AcrR family transcriptional regulator